MKKRRTLIIALLLVATLAIGFGYAATSGHLQINGTVSTRDQAFAMIFTKYETKEASTGVTAFTGVNADNPGYNDSSISFHVQGLSKNDDYLIGEFTVQNLNEFDMYLITASVTNPNENLFTVTPPTFSNGAVKVEPQGTTTFQVRIDLNAGVSEGQIDGYEFQVKIFASADKDAVHTPSN